MMPGWPGSAPRGGGTPGSRSPRCGWPGSSPPPAPRRPGRRRNSAARLISSRRSRPGWAAPGPAPESQARLSRYPRPEPRAGRPGPPAFRSAAQVNGWTAAAGVRCSSRSAAISVQLSPSTRARSGGPYRATGRPEHSGGPSGAKQPMTATAARPGGVVQRLRVLLLLGRAGHEVQHGPVVPGRVAALGLPVAQVGDQPVHLCRPGCRARARPAGSRPVRCPAR